MWHGHKNNSYKKTKRDIDSKVNLKVFREMVNEIKTNKMAWRLFAENYFFKFFFQFFIENIGSKTIQKYHNVGLTLKLWKRSRSPTFKLWRGSLDSIFKLWGSTQGPKVLSPGVLVPLLYHAYQNKGILFDKR